MRLPPILEASAVHDRSMRPVWLAAAAAAGMVNTITFLACARFVTHVTGTLTHVGMDYDRVLLLGEYALVLLAFVGGAMLSFAMIDRRRMLGRPAWPTAPLLLVGACLLVTAALGTLGAFGPFGQTVETTGDFFLLSILAFCMGLQNASIATTTGLIVRTTHMTGPLTDFSIALSAYLSSSAPEVRAAARESVGLRGAKIASFVAGCVFAAITAPHAQYLAYCIPAALLGYAALQLRVGIGRRAEPPQPARVAEPVALGDSGVLRPVPRA